MIDRVTVTGADDSINPEDLIPLTEKYPFVEWGILLSKSRENSARYPSLAWMERLAAVQAKHPMKLSGHLCGRWVRELCQGILSFCVERPTISRLFPRVQLNFHGMAHEVDETKFIDALNAWDRDYIFQFDEVNNSLMTKAGKEGVRVAPLFDTSGGAGIEPGSWPRPCAAYCGYAGGLHPDKLHEQLPKILEAAGRSRIWIDVETHVRTRDEEFDLEKVERFLAQVAPHVSP